MADIQLPKTDTSIKTYTSVTTTTQTSTTTSTPAAAPSTSTTSTGQVATDQSKVGTKDLSNFNDGFKMDALGKGGMDTINGGGIDTLTPKDPPKDIPIKSDPVTTDPVIKKPDPNYDNVIEVAGSGMGSDKKFKMLPGELMAITEILKDGKMLSLQDMQKILKEKYGIETQIKDNAIVSSDGGRTIICDTNGNGVLDAGDLKMDSALSQLDGYFKDQTSKLKAQSMIMEMIERSNEYSKEREEANKQATKSSGTSTTTTTTTASVSSAGATAGTAAATTAASTATRTAATTAAATTTTTTKPKTETKKEAPKTETKKEAPKTEAKKEAPKTEAKKEEKKPETYTVVKGDTLIGIARKLGVNYEDLKAANPQFYKDGKDDAGRKRESDGHWIYPGDQVNIPAKK